MPRYFVAYRKTEEAGQKPEWASFTTESPAALEAHAIRERVDKRLGLFGERLTGRGGGAVPRLGAPRRVPRAPGGGPAGRLHRLRPAGLGGQTALGHSRCPRRPASALGSAERIVRKAKSDPMPKRTDIQKILIIGAGPIVIGQACEFDYSGTQACKALREEGYEVVLVNSNPATIMTDPEMADRTYIEPITPEVVEQIIAVERPDAVLPTLGGQTGLNVGLALHESGVLEPLRLRADRRQAPRRSARPRTASCSRRCMEEIGLRAPAAGWRTASTRPARSSATRSACPASSGRASPWAAPAAAIAYNREEFDRHGRLRARAQPGRTRSWSRRASSAGKSTRWR